MSVKAGAGLGCPQAERSEPRLGAELPPGRPTRQPSGAGGFPVISRPGQGAGGAPRSPEGREMAAARNCLWFASSRLARLC